MQDLFDWFEQQLAAEEQEVEASHQVAHAEDTDACGPRDEDDGEDKPEQVAKHDDLQHVQVGPGGQWWNRYVSFPEGFQSRQIH